ncbi:MAG: hypothetical protein N3D74_06080 [Caldisericia bacterium]|nr:hypothetical protein [Caldisericia bacterium]
MKKFFKVLLRIFIPILIILIVLGYFGFVPFISDILGTNKPKDLGVNFTEKDFESARSKTGVKWETLKGDIKPEESLKYSGKRSVRMDLTSSELTSLTYERKWRYYPLKNWTVKINKDGTVETSGQILTNKLMDSLKAFGISLEKSLNNIDLKYGILGSLQNPQIERFYSLLNQISRFIKSNPSFYIKGKAEIKNNKITLLELQSVYLGKLNLTNTVNKYIGEIKSFIEEILNNTPGLYVTSLIFQDMKLKFVGTLPAVESHLE